MANNLIRVAAKEVFTYNGKVVVINNELTVCAKIADALVERGLVTVIGEETVGDENTDELDGMTIDELKEYAAEAGIDLRGKSKKAEILSAIREAV